jgi:hypothetical protein
VRLDRQGRFNSQPKAVTKGKRAAWFMQLRVLLSIGADGLRTRVSQTSEIDGSIADLHLPSRDRSL